MRGAPTAAPTPVGGGPPRWRLLLLLLPIGALLLAAGIAVLVQQTAFQPMGRSSRR